MLIGVDAAVKHYQISPLTFFFFQKLILCLPLQGFCPQAQFALLSDIYDLGYFHPGFIFLKANTEYCFYNPAKVSMY